MCLFSLFSTVVVLSHVPASIISPNDKLYSEKFYPNKPFFPNTLVTATEMKPGQRSWVCHLQPWNTEPIVINKPHKGLQGVKLGWWVFKLPIIQQAHSRYWSKWKVWGSLGERGSAVSCADKRLEMFWEKREEGGGMPSTRDLSELGREEVHVEP